MAFARSTIDVPAVLREVPDFQTFCSVQKLHELISALQNDSRFQITVIGDSVHGVPIHHVRFGRGRIKALIVGFPHCMEPIGGLTVFSLLTLLGRSNRTLLEADVEWNVIPCVDPDGALLNEGWTQKRFSLENRMKHYYLQPLADQVDTSFPIAYKKNVWERPSKEARILMDVLESVRPDFFFSLHNAQMGGAFYYLSRDIGHRFCSQIRQLLEANRFPLQRRPMWREVCSEFSPGFVEFPWRWKRYDYLEQTTPSPERFLNYGVASWDHLAQINPEALTFVAEMGYVRHPSDESENETDENLRQFKLRLDADSKFLAVMLAEEWEKVRNEINFESPFYRVIVERMALMTPDRLCEGGYPLSRYPTRDILFNPEHDRMMTEGDRFAACMVDGGYTFIVSSYQFVRLLKDSAQTAPVRHALERLSPAFDAALRQLGRYIDFGAFEVFSCKTLAKVQLGSGLIALNSLLDAQLQ